jgi:hypothetical protein
MAETTSTEGSGINQVVGEVFILYGKVKAIAPDDTVRVLAVNSPVFAMDRIVTESDGSVSIMLDGQPPTQIDIGRMSDILIDEDVYAGVVPGEVAEATAEAEEIQTVLLEGEGQIELEATAAGGTLDSGDDHPTVVFELTGDEVTPESGAETTGVSSLGADTFMAGQGHDTILDYSHAEGDTLDFTHITGLDHYGVRDNAGKAELVLYGDEGETNELGSVTFDNIDYTELAPGSELDSLLGMIGEDPEGSTT